ncbi:MAG: S8 family serine peptidase, partial [bacterium]
EAFKWAVDNGADVISCSWGPQDGDWWDLNDQQHKQVFQIPASTRLAIDYAVQYGRGGKGCVIFFASGNGNESVDNDGYASYSKVIAVAACNDRGTRSVYSDFGSAVWCAFPSGDSEHPPFNHA